MLSWICAECGAPTASEEESLDTGTELTCSQCHKGTVVELHTVKGYVRANAIIEAARTLIEAEKGSVNAKMHFAMDCLLNDLKTAVDGQNT